MSLQIMYELGSCKSLPGISLRQKHSWDIFQFIFLFEKRDAPYVLLQSKNSIFERDVSWHS